MFMLPWTHNFLCGGSKKVVLNSDSIKYWYSIYYVPGISLRMYAGPLFLWA